MSKRLGKNIGMIVAAGFLLFTIIMLCSSERVRADDFSDQLANAILADPSTLESSSYTDKSSSDQQATILTSLGDIMPTDGESFILLSTGVAGTVATTDGQDPGDERGTWFGPQYPKKAKKFDKAILTLDLQVPSGMHYLYYTSQFFSTEGPEWIDAGYNDKLTVTATHNGITLGTHITDVDEHGGDLVLDAYDIPGTGFDLFAKVKGTTDPDDPEDVDWVSTIPGVFGSDANAALAVDRGFQVPENEIITLTFNIRDAGDNQLDSAAYIDNVVFWPEIRANISAKKTVEDLNGGIAEPGDILEYTIDISNIGIVDQKNNDGDEFEDFIPDSTTYVTDSASAESAVGDPDPPIYDPVENKITWNGEIPAHSSVRITFQVTINGDTLDGTVISNQGNVSWDSSDDGIDENDAIELTDDPDIDDGIDQDGDGATDDDDPTNITAFRFPETVTEDFSDDQPGGKATESYAGYTWFETSETSGEGNFEVASNYNYSASIHDYISTSHSFKTKMRSSSSPQYWNYTLSDLNSNISWWEAWFACGNASEAANLSLIFTNDIGEVAARIRFDYVHADTESPMDWLLELYYRDPDYEDEWSRLYSDFVGGYLYNDWYKLKIEENDLGNIDYSLNRTGRGLVASGTGVQLDVPFSNFTSLKWESTKNPVACPMFFWDEHTIGLTTIS